MLSLFDMAKQLATGIETTGAHPANKTSVRLNSLGLSLLCLLALFRLGLRLVQLPLSFLLLLVFNEFFLPSLYLFLALQLQQLFFLLLLLLLKLLFPLQFSSTPLQLLPPPLLLQDKAILCPLFLQFRYRLPHFSVRMFASIPLLADLRPLVPGCAPARPFVYSVPGLFEVLEQRIAAVEVVVTEHARPFILLFLAVKQRSESKGIKKVIINRTLSGHEIPIVIGVFREMVEEISSFGER